MTLGNLLADTVRPTLEGKWRSRPSRLAYDDVRFRFGSSGVNRLVLYLKHYLTLQVNATSLAFFVNNPECLISQNLQYHT